MPLRKQAIALQPLDIQMGATQLRAVPDPIDSLLFGADALPVYAIVDAALLPGFEGPEGANGLRAACLFNGAAADDLGDCAPYLIELKPDHTFTRALFTRGETPWDHWDRSAAILLQTGASFDSVREHFRRFTKIADAAGTWFFLRFYMPQAMDEILDGLMQSPAHLLRWFQLRGNAPVFRYVVPRPDLDVVHMYEADGLWDQTTGQQPARYQLDPHYEAILRKIRDLRLEARMTRAITHDYVNLHHLEDAQIRDLVRTSIAMARAEGLRTELALGQFAAAGFIIGQPLTRAHLARVPEYCDLRAHDNRRTKALLDHAEAAVARQQRGAA